MSIVVSIDNRFIYPSPNKFRRWFDRSTWIKRRIKPFGLMPRSALWIQEGYAFPSTRQAEILRIPICWWLNLSRTRGTFSSWTAAASCRYLQNCVKNSKKGKKLGRIYLKKSLFPQRCSRFSSCPTYLVSCMFLYIPACNRCCHALGSLFFANGRIPMNNIWTFFRLISDLKHERKAGMVGVKSDLHR